MEKKGKYPHSVFCFQLTTFFLAGRKLRAVGGGESWGTGGTFLKRSDQEF